MLGQIMNKAVALGFLDEADFMNKSEKEIMEKLEGALKPEVPAVAELVEAQEPKRQFARLYKTFRTMTKIEHTDKPLSDNEYFCVSLKVKQRYIDPLVQTSGMINAQRLSKCSAKAARIISDFLSYSDTAYGCVKLI